MSAKALKDVYEHFKLKAKLTVWDSITVCIRKVKSRRTYLAELATGRSTWRTQSTKHHLPKNGMARGQYPIGRLRSPPNEEDKGILNANFRRQKLFGIIFSVWNEEHLNTEEN